MLIYDIYLREFRQKSKSKDPASTLVKILDTTTVDFSKIVDLFKVFSQVLGENEGNFTDAVLAPEDETGDSGMENISENRAEEEEIAFMVRPELIVLFSRALSQLLEYGLISIFDSEICKRFYPKIKGRQRSSADDEKQMYALKAFNFIEQIEGR